MDEIILVCGEMIVAANKKMNFLRGKSLMERNLNSYFQRLMYAASADIESSWEGEPRYGGEYHNYETFKHPPGDRKLKSRFRFTPAVKCILGGIIAQSIEEVLNLEIDKQVCALSRDEFIQTLITQSEELGEDKFIPWLVRFSMSTHNIGQTLTSELDSKNYVSNYINNKCQQSRTDSEFLSRFTNEIDRFLKSMAAQLTSFLWFCDSTLSAKFLLGFLASRGMTNYMLDQLENTLPRKPVTKKPAATKPAATKSATAKTASEKTSPKAKKAISIKAAETTAPATKEKPRRGRPPKNTVAAPVQEEERSDEPQTESEESTEEIFEDF